MSLRVFAPCKLLAPYVTAIWDYDDLTGSDNSALSILPDTATYLCFLYADLLQTTHKDAIYTTRSGLAGFQSYRSDLGGVGNISGVSALGIVVWTIDFESKPEDSASVAELVQSAISAGIDGMEKDLMK